jgi:hypothetical protein
MGIEPMTYALRVASRKSTHLATSPAGACRRVPRSVSDRALGCSVGCSASWGCRRVDRVVRKHVRYLSSDKSGTTDEDQSSHAHGPSVPRVLDRADACG